MKILVVINELAGLRARWTALSAREQGMVKWGAAIVLPLLCYGLLWQPAHNGVARLQHNVPQLRAQLTQMQAQAIEVQNLRHGAHPAVLEGEALRHIVEIAIRAVGWNAPAVTVELAEKSTVRIHADSIEFGRCLRFLHELENTQHIRPSALTITSTPTRGMVKVDGVLSNGEEE